MSWIKYRNLLWISLKTNKLRNEYNEEGGRSANVRVDLPQWAILFPFILFEKQKNVYYLIRVVCSEALVKIVSVVLADL